MLDRPIAVKIEAAVGERIGRDVDHAHDQGPLAQFEHSRSQVPLKDRTHGADCN